MNSKDLRERFGLIVAILLRPEDEACEVPKIKSECFVPD